MACEGESGERQQGSARASQQLLSGIDPTSSTCADEDITKGIPSCQSPFYIRDRETPYPNVKIGSDPKSGRPVNELEERADDFPILWMDFPPYRHKRDVHGNVILDGNNNPVIDYTYDDDVHTGFRDRLKRIAATGATSVMPYFGSHVYSGERPKWAISENARDYIRQAGCLEPYDTTDCQPLRVVLNLPTKMLRYQHLDVFKPNWETGNIAPNDLRAELLAGTRRFIKSINDNSDLSKAVSAWYIADEASLHEWPISSGVMRELYDNIKEADPGRDVYLVDVPDTSVWTKGSHTGGHGFADHGYWIHPHHWDPDEGFDLDVSE